MKTGNKVGRPTKYTEEVVEKILSALRGGNYRTIAAQYAGIGERTFDSWFKDNEEFRRLVLEAESGAEIRCVGLIMKHAADDPKHAEWYLERKFHERWGRKDKMQVSGDKDEPLVTEIKITYDDQDSTE